MGPAAGTFALAFLAGGLSTLSPCVVPLLPILIGSAAGAHRRGPLALAAGVALSFAATGIFLATIGFSLGLDADVVRDAAAVLMALLGAVLLSATLQAGFTRAASGLQAAAGNRLARMNGSGLAGQFAVGLLLGVVWSPCSGPTLGAASVLAAQQQHLGAVALTMVLFGLGAAVPLVAAGAVSRTVLLRWRGRALSAGQGGKLVFGGALVCLSALILTGVDRQLEAAFVAHAPDWLNAVSGLV